MDLIFDDTGYGELMPAGKCSIPIKGDRVKKQIDPVFQGQGPGQLRETVVVTDNRGGANPGYVEDKHMAAGLEIRFFKGFDKLGDVHFVVMANQFSISVDNNL